MQARPHQVKGRESVIESFDDGYHRQIVNMATGTGKTFLFADLYVHLLSRLPGKMLVLAHTEELVDQNIATIKAVNPTLRVDKEMAEHKADPSQADIIVASVASLGRKGSSRLAKYNWDEWSTVVVDEAHHTPASSYLNILGACGVLQPSSNKLLLGVTATSQRSDGKALSGIYDKISYVYSLRQAIEDGQLVDVRGYKVDTRTSIESVVTSGGDFKQTDLADTVNNSDRNTRIVQAWEELAESRQTVAFCASIKHAQDLAAEFTTAGISADAIWGDDPNREEKLALHRAGKIKVLCNCQVLTEGYDDPSISCILLARPTKSPVLFTQMCGRGTRLQDGKKDCLIIDVVDMSGDHTLCTVPTLMGLPDKLDLCGQSLYKSVKEIEKAQEENPNIDFMKMQKITDLKSFVENINLFEVRFPKEVEEHSDFKWCQSVTGGYRMSIPKGRNGEAAGFVHIQQNMLDGWEIKGQIRGIDVVGQRPTMEEAFAAADNAIRTRAEGSVALVDRKSSWNTKEATPAQLGLLKKLYGKFKQFPATLTRGQAAFYIDQKISKRAK